MDRSAAPFFAPSTPPPWPPAGWEELCSLLPPRVRRLVCRMPSEFQQDLRELRLRAEGPVVAVLARRSCYLDPEGRPCADPGRAYRLSGDEARTFLLAVTGSSLHAHARELREGFLTLPGGHRVGFTGQGVMEDGRLRILRHVSGFNVRLAREVKGAAAAVAPRLMLPSGRLAHTLIVSPPGCGKTTLLRDLARIVSGGDGAPGPGRRVALIDERSEIAACRDGVPMLEVGPNTDVLDGIPKAVGIPMALRALGPQVIMTDEIGSSDDLAALADARRCGVTVIATAHGDALEQTVSALPLAGRGGWERAVLISDRRGPGTVERVAVISPSTSP